MSDNSDEKDVSQSHQASIAAIKAEVLEQVMVELRPLLKQLAELAAAKNGGADPAYPTARALQDQAVARMEEMRKRVADKINLRQAQMLKRSGK